LLATVSGAVTEPGVREVPVGISLEELLAAAGGPARPLQAVLVGGYHGTWVPARAAAVPLSRAGLGTVGGTIGAGVVVALEAGHCGLAAAAGVVAYLSRQSAGQCGPCLNGLPAMAQALSALAEGRGRADLPARVQWLADLVDGRGACHHPDGTARLVRSSLTVFGDEVMRHLDGHCVARSGS
jgi:NADH:ubiquinone oxidoreductase subunit F (NADH-binding)